ncbi:MAG TPA: amidohydrolase family protein [Planctomycetota bacterium]
MQALLPLLLFVFSLAGGDDPIGPRDGVFLLRSVTVWNADGSLTEDRSLLLRGGVIEAVGGADLAAPPEARVVEAGADWLAYPGLVHARFDLNGTKVPASPFHNEATDPRRDPIPAMEWGTRKDLRAWLRVADVLAWEPDKAAKWRLAGFTSGYLLPDQGLVRGRAAWVSLNDRPLGDALLAREGLLTLSLAAAPGGYPGTPMATLATLRQAFLDAQRMRAATGGRERTDPDAVALRDYEGALLFHANSAREIENVLDLVRDYAPDHPLVILGGRDAWKHAARLKTTGTSVLYVLDLPDAPKSDEKLKVAPADARPWWQSPARLREERRAVHAEHVAGFRLLRESGVRCALVPDGSPKELAEDLVQLRDDGLTDDELIAALGPDVAAVLGLQGVGTLEAGAGADLVIHRGPWAPDKAKLAWVFADGRGWEFPAPEEEAEEAADAEKPASEKDDEPKAEADDPGLLFDGTWTFEVSPPGADEAMPIRLVVDTAGPSVEAGPADEPDEAIAGRDVAIDGDVLTFVLDVPDMPEPFKVRMQSFGELAEVTMDTPFGKLTMEAERSGGPAGAGPAKPKQDADKAGADSEADAFPLGHPEALVEVRADRVPHLALDGDVLLKGGTLHTMTGRGPFVGDLLIRDGKIAAVGGRQVAPAGVTVIDVSGQHVMPGVIDAHSHLALDAVNEGSVAITAECRIADMIHPESVSIFRAAAGGTAVNQSLHGSANPIGGQAAVWELDVNRRSIGELLVPGAAQGIKFALGENVKQSNFGRGGNRFPTSRSGVEAVYRRAFTRAREYAQERERGAPGFRPDVRLEVLAGILANEIHVQCHSYRADEILMFLRICEEFGIKRPTFQHVLEGYKVAPELAAAGAMASTFSDWWAYKIEAYDAIPWNTWLLDRAGVTVSINSDSGEMIRRLNTEAGKGLRYGQMDLEAAMAMCTLAPATQLRLEDRLGSLEKGKDGTVTVYDAAPLSSYARCTLTLARGRALFARAPEHDAAWEAYGAAARTFAAEHAAAAPARPERQPDREEWERWTRPGLGLATLILGATIHPVSAPPFVGTVLIADGRFAYVAEGGWDGALPEGSEVVQADGLHLYPGLISASERIGLYEIGSVAGTLDSRETGDWQPDLSIATAIHADSTHHAVHRMNGVTHALVRATSGTLGGQAALVALDGETPMEMAVVPDLGLSVRFPHVSAPADEKAPEDPDALAELDRWFDDALAQAGRIERLREADLPMLGQDLKLRALLPYARAEKPVLLDCADRFTLMRAVRWVEDRGLDAIYFVGDDAWQVAGYLGARGARVVPPPVHSLPGSRDDVYDSAYRGAGLLARAGCDVALRTDNPEVTRNLPFQAATAAAHGLGKEAALYALTLGAARMLGVDELTGSIETGKVANFFLAEGDPLDNPGRVVRLWIGGKPVPLESKQTLLRDRYAERLERKLAERDSPPQPTGVRVTTDN